MDTRTYPVLVHFDEKRQEKVTKFQERGKQALSPTALQAQRGARLSSSGECAE